LRLKPFTCAANIFLAATAAITFWVQDADGVLAYPFGKLAAFAYASISSSAARGDSRHD
jgi:hypothetical protein